MKKNEYYSLSKQELKKQKLIKWLSISGTILFFLIGLTLGIVGLYVSGWDFIKFITNPAFSFGTIVFIILAILGLSIFLMRKGNKGYGE